MRTRTADRNAPTRTRRALFAFRIVWIAALAAAIGASSCESNPEEPTERQTKSSAESTDPLVRRASEGSENRLGAGPEPRHGGVVRSVDVYHVEVVPSPFEVWLYDRRGNPVPIEDVEGQIVLYTADERRPHELESEGAYLAPIEPLELPEEGSAFVELTIGEQPIDVALALPLRADVPPR